MQSSGLKVKTFLTADEIRADHAFMTFYGFFPYQSYEDILAKLKLARPMLSEDQAKETARKVRDAFDSSPCRMASLYDGDDTVYVLLSHTGSQS